MLNLGINQCSRHQSTCNAQTGLLALTDIMHTLLKRQPKASGLADREVQVCLDMQPCCRLQYSMGSNST